MRKHFTRTLPILLLVLILAACTPPTPPSPTATSQPIRADTATATSVPTATATPLPTATSLSSVSDTPAPAAAEHLPSLSQMRWFDLKHGWGILGQTNYQLVHTDDGGQTWRNVMPAPRMQIDYPDNDLFFLDASTAWVVLTTGVNGVTTRMLYRTTDGGQTWQSWPAPFQIMNLAFFDANNGWNAAVGSQQQNGGVVYDFYRTSDGGQTWTRADVTGPNGESGLPVDPDLGNGWGFEFQNLKTIWFWAGADDLRVSQDAGKTWKAIRLPAAQSYQNQPGGKLFDIASLGGPLQRALPTFISEQEGFFYVWTTPQQMTVYHTIDGGENWSAVSSGYQGEMNTTSSVQFVTAQDWYALSVSGNTLSATHNGGKSWEKVPTPRNTEDGASTLSTQFIDAANGFALVLLPNSGGDDTLFRTSDGGQTWQQVQPRLVGVAPTLAPYPTAPVADLPAAAPTAQPTIVVTPGAFPQVNQFIFLDAQTAFATLGPKYNLDNNTVIPGTSRLLRSVDGGHTWQYVTLPARVDGELTGVLSAQDFWIVVHASQVPMEGKDTLYHTKDGGQTWKKINAPFSAGSIQMFDEKTGWVISGYGGCGAGTCWEQLYSTTDGGQTWNLYHPAPPFSTDSTWPEGTIGLHSGTGFQFQSLDTIWEGGGYSDYGAPELRVSRDRGQTWQEIRFSLPESMHVAHMRLPTFLNENDGFISITVSIGGSPYPSGNDHMAQAIFTTSDGGRTWTPRPLLDTNEWNSEAQFVTPADWFSSCLGALCATHDRGQTWRALPLPEPAGSWGFMVGRFFDPQNGYGTASSPSTNNQDVIDLYLTHDGGQTWEKVEPVMK